MKRTSKLLSLLLALVLMFGLMQTFYAAPPSNNVFSSQFFIKTGDSWLPIDKDTALNSTQSKKLQKLFDRYFKNDLVGVYLAQNTTQIAVKPLKDKDIKVVVYNPDSNTFRQLTLLRVDENGFYIFGVPAGMSFPLNLVFSNATLVVGPKPAAPKSSVIGGNGNSNNSGNKSSRSRNSSNSPSSSSTHYNFKNYTVARSPREISNSVFSMEIPANVPYHIDIEQRVRNYCDWLQTASGLSFSPDIVDITNDGGNAYGGAFGINVEDMDYILDVPGAEYVYLHELTHTLQYRLVEINCQPFTEAFAILNSAKVAKNHNLDYLYWFLMNNNYSGVDSSEETDILSDFEDFFRTEDGTWNSYLFGFRFGVYLEETYGDDIFSDLIEAYATLKGDNPSTQNEFVDFLKNQTSASVFDDFVTWYGNNKSTFNSTSCPVIDNSEIIFMPIINNNYQSFQGGDTYKLNGSIVLDFNDSHAYAEFKGYTIIGISGDFSFDDTVTIESYDANDTLLQTKQFQLGPQSLTFTDTKTVKLIISGYNGEFTFQPIFDDCYSR